MSLKHDIVDKLVYSVRAMVTNAIDDHMRENTIFCLPSDVFRPIYRNVQEDIFTARASIRDRLNTQLTEYEFNSNGD